MPEPTLNERFRGKPPTRSSEDRGAWLSADEQRFILWGLKERWSAARIGRALGVNEVTVRRFRKSVWDDPRVLLDLDLIEMVPRGSSENYRCLVCGDRLIFRQEAEHHVVAHYVD